MVRLAWVAILPLLAGCLSVEPALETEDLLADFQIPRLFLDEADIQGAVELQWGNRTLDRAPDPPRPPVVSSPPPMRPCKDVPKECDAFTFVLKATAKSWALAPGYLEVTVQARPGDYADGYPNVRLLHNGKPVVGIPAIAGGKYAHSFFLPDAASGTYTVETRISAGHVVYDGIAQIEGAYAIFDKASQPRDLLPDLVMLRPLDLKVDLETWSNLGDGQAMPKELRQAMAATGIRGCAPDEVTDNGARRCLRVSTTIGNIGEGPLAVVMPSSEAAKLVTANGQFFQWIFQSTGAHRERPASAQGLFHASHAHLHYPNLVKLQVFEYDLEAHARGKEVGRGSKTGFCLANEGIFELGLPNTTRPQSLTPGTCISPMVSQGFRAWSMGIWPQWFDMYETYRTGQFAEISGVPDGVYEFAVTADPDDTILESDETNNQNSVLFRLKGDAVQVLPDAD